MVPWVAKPKKTTHTWLHCGGYGAQSSGQAADLYNSGTTSKGHWWSTKKEGHHQRSCRPLLSEVVNPSGGYVVGQKKRFIEKEKRNIK
jgi:hypothetical protein